MFEKLKNFLRNLVSPILDTVAILASITAMGITLVVLMLSLILGIIGGPLGAGIAAIVLTVVGVFITMITSIITLLFQLLSKVPDSVAKIYAWTWKILRNLETLFGILNATDKFNENVKPKEAKTVWRSFKDSVETFIFGAKDKLKDAMADFEQKIAKSMGKSIEQLKKQIVDIEAKFSKIEGTEGVEETFGIHEIFEGLKGSSKYKENDYVNEDGTKGEKESDTPTEGEVVMAKLNEISAQIETFRTEVNTKDEGAPAEGDVVSTKLDLLSNQIDTLTNESIAEIKEALLRIEGSLSMAEITQALGNLQIAMENLTTGKGADGVTNEDLGVEIRDSKRSTEADITNIKDQLAVLVQLIEKKAMTFDDIYTMVFRRLAREHEMQTGRRIG